MPKCVCKKHGLKLFCEKSGVYAVECRDQALTVPYKIWSADRYVCPVDGCWIEVITGFSDNPWVDHHADFEATLEKIKANPKNEIIYFY